MGEIINKQFEEYQKELKIRDLRLKLPTTFETSEELDEVLNELKQKEILL